MAAQWPCAVCGKRPSRRDWLIPDGPDKMARVCSEACREYFRTRTKPLIDPTKNEREAMAYAGAMGGEYLESVGKTDLVLLTVDEYDTFIGAVCSGYSEKMLELAEKAYGVGKSLRAKVTVDDLPY